MKKLSLFSIAFVLLMARSALGQSIDLDFDHDADFSKFKTYKWVTFNNPAPIDNLTDEQIKAAVNGALAQKGLTRVDADTADLLVDYQSSELITEEVPRIPVRDPGPLPTIYQGDLAIDMYTPANRHLVWRGVARKTLDPKANPEKRQNNLSKAVTKLMKNYPPKTG